MNADEVSGTAAASSKALPMLGKAPFFHVNADPCGSLACGPTLARLAETLDTRARGFILLLMAPDHEQHRLRRGPSAYNAMSPTGALRKSRELRSVPFRLGGSRIMVAVAIADDHG